MRAGPLSEPQVIALLNGFFVPVYASNEDYQEQGRAPADEKALYRQIYREADAEGRPVGSVCVYLVAPDGDGIESMSLDDATQPGRLEQLLASVAQQWRVESGPPVVPPRPQSAPPAAARGALVLHLVSRYNRDGSWADFPSENWIVLEQSQWEKLLPQADLQPGSAWDVERELATTMLTHFYPQTEVCHFEEDTAPDGPHKHRIQQQVLEASMLSAADGVTTVRLDGYVRIKHTFYPDRDDDRHVSASVAGFFEFDRGSRRIRSLQLISGEAIYGDESFTVAVRSVEDER